MIRATLIVLATLIGQDPSRAADGGVRDRLIDLATLEITHELCHFPLDDAQQDTVNATRNGLVERDEATETEVAAVHRDIEASLGRQVPEGLCKPGGAGERFYKQLLGTLERP